MPRLPIPSSDVARSVRALASVLRLLDSRRAVARAALPRVARPSLPPRAQSAVDARGLVFFLAAE